MEDGSDLNVEGVEGDDVEYDFVINARDIMNKFPCPDAAASTKICAFRKTFGTSMVWSMLWEETSSQRAAAQSIFSGLSISSRFIPYRPRGVQPSAGLLAPSTRRPTKSGSGHLSTP
jgi:hypothetical protein